ncbi:hypothetical protein J2X73_002544 [Novosphingobium sp. 1748]|uniref:hypothetical protein n=1 Tax=Novosphingobium sp. 1748 TaxID=2817760 RepID=UPI002864A4E9|nr:hypothetical protein [Novosphingobium sp. 1748]MDR6708173.1 hypothetical protein [Novosphingobium sp. 1748]
MLPRLQAQEKLAAIDVALLASGGFGQRDAQAMLGGLRRQANGVEHMPKVRASSAQLGMIGIGVRIVPPPQEAANG